MALGRRSLALRELKRCPDVADDGEHHRSGAGDARYPEVGLFDAKLTENAHC
jgi:hypothetical protein